MRDVPPPTSSTGPSPPPVPWGWPSWSTPTYGSGRAAGRRGAVIAVVCGLVLTLVLAVGGVAVANRFAPPGRRPVPSPSSSSPPLTTNVTGFVYLDDRATAANDCEGAGSNADIGTGTPVSLTDGSGVELGSAELVTQSLIGSRCGYAFIINDVPAGEPVYVVQVGEREPVTTSHDELRSQAWGFTITL